MVAAKALGPSTGPVGSARAAGPILSDAQVPRRYDAHDAPGIPAQAVTAGSLAQVTPGQPPQPVEVYTSPITEEPVMTETPAPIEVEPVDVPAGVEPVATPSSDPAVAEPVAPQTESADSAE